MAQRPIHVLSPTDGQSYAGLGTLRCKIPSQMTADACTVLELRLAPGQGSGLHVHLHEEEIVLVQEGRCTVGQRGQRWELEAGSWVVFPRQTPHFFHNDGDSVCTDASLPTFKSMSIMLT